MYVCKSETFLYINIKKLPYYDFKKTYEYIACKMRLLFHSMTELSLSELLMLRLMFENYVYWKILITYLHMIVFEVECKPGDDDACGCLWNTAFVTMLQWDLTLVY